MKLQMHTNEQLSDDVYHSEEFKDFLSGSELWEFIDKSPAEAVYGEKKDTEAFKFGSLVHCAILEPELFERKYAMDFKASEDCLTSDAAMKAWLKAHGIAGYSSQKGFELVGMVKKAEPNQMCFIDEQRKYQELHEGKEFIKPAIFEQLQGMRETMQRYVSYQSLIDSSDCEVSITGESELLNGQKVQVRPDIFQKGCICNYKTTNNAKPDHVIADSFKLGYFMKEYFNALIVSELTGDFPEVLILAQSKVAPYVVTGIKLTDEQLEIGRIQFEKAFALWSACKDAGAYIDYAQGEWLEVETPQWMVSKTVN